MSKITLWFNETNCSGCHACEVACKQEHGLGVGPRVVRVIERAPLFKPLYCHHCEDAPCLDACMTGAMHRDPKTGAVICDEDKCVGCWMCIMVCPFGVIARNTQGKKVASKCDLCGGEKTPVCVKNCPNEAIVVEEI